MRLLLAAFALLLFAVACGSGGGDYAQPTPQVLVGGPLQVQAEGTPPEVTTPDTAVGQTPVPTPGREPQLVSLDWLGADAGVTGLDAGIAPPVLDAGLQAAVADALDGFEGHASVVVHNLEDGRYAARNESESYYAASTFKAAVLLEAYRQRDAGELDFDRKVKLEEKYTENDLGTLEYLELHANDEITVRDALKGMIVVSDTSLAVMLVDVVGSNRIDAMLRSIGATTMTVNDRGLPVTSLDLAQLMIAIASGQGVAAESRDEMLSLMAQEWFTEGIAAGLPEGAAYSHKSGNLGTATHDAAIVWGPAGPYVIVVMTDGSGGWTPIADVSAAVWQYFATNP